MTLSTFFLVCMLIGLMLSLILFAAGTLHIPHLHPHFLHGHLHLGHGDFAAHRGAAGTAGSHEFSRINFATATAFLVWFGAAGYLLTRYSPLVLAAIVVFAVAIGVVGASIVFWFVFKVLLPHDLALDPADYDRVGVLGRVVSPIREGGTGEIVFSQEGTRQTCGARGENGEALPRGIEIVVTRYEHGIAYVRRWEDLTGDREDRPQVSPADGLRSDRSN